MKHSSVNGLVNEQIVQEMYDMFVENSRKYLDYSPSPADAKSLQFKGKDRKNRRNKVQENPADYACHFCGSADHWIKDCPHKPTQFAGSQGQSSSSGNKGQSTRIQPRPQSGQKGDKGKGKGKSKKDVKKKLGKTSLRIKYKPAARSLEGEEEYETEYETENEEENEE